MWGSIIGDLAGSIYEYDQTKEVHLVEVNKIIEDNAFYSDDTIMTVAMADAILNGGKYKDYIKKYGFNYIDYHPDFKPYFRFSFSPGFLNWLVKNKANKSIGNGALMRISPVGFMYNDEKEISHEVFESTSVTHDTYEAINSSLLVALIIYYFRNGISKEEVLEKLKIKLKYRPFNKFNTTCSETLGNVLYAVFKSNSYEDAIRNVISFGGDTDTNACIAGGMAEALYGVPEELIAKAKEYIPEEFTKVLTRAYNYKKHM